MRGDVAVCIFLLSRSACSNRRLGGIPAEMRSELGRVSGVASEAAGGAGRAVRAVCCGMRNHSFVSDDHPACDLLWLCFCRCVLLLTGSLPALLALCAPRPLRRAAQPETPRALQHALHTKKIRSTASRGSANSGEAHVWRARRSGKVGPELRRLGGHVLARAHHAVLVQVQRLAPAVRQPANRTPQGAPQQRCPLERAPG